MSLLVIVVMLLAAFPVFAQDPLPTDKYDLLPGLASAPFSLPATGLSRAQKADLARWQGLATQHSASVPSSLPVTGLNRAQQADAARWRGLASRFLGFTPSTLPTTGLARGQQADAARWRAWAETFAGNR